MKIGPLGFSLALTLALFAVSAPAAAQTSGDACYPLCRPGFLCHQGQCISACNPPCAAGQSCTASGECSGEAGPQMQAAPPPPPPSYPEETRPPQQPLYPNPEPEIEPGRKYFANAYVPRHEGFMLRLTLGFGGGFSTIQYDTPDDDEDQLSSYGFTGSFDVGGAIAPNLDLHGRFASFSLIEPNIEVNGEDRGELDDVSAVASLFGGGLTYYLMPANVYFTGVVGFSWLSLRTCYEYDYEYGYDCEAATTDVGFGLNADVGKEWWIAKSWGMGVAGRFWYSYVRDNDTVDTDSDFVGFAVLFSVTYQ